MSAGVVASQTQGHSADLQGGLTTERAGSDLAAGRAQLIISDDRGAIPLDARSGSLPNSTVLYALFRRTARTVGPLLVSDVSALALSGLFAEAVLVLLGPPALAPLQWLAPVALLPLVIAYWLAGLYSEIWVHPVIELRQLTQVSSLALLAAAAAALAAWPLPLWCLTAWVAVLALVPLLRTIARRLCESRAWWGYPTLIIGSGNGANELARLLLECPRSGLRPVMITDPQGHCRASVMPVVNDPATLESLIRAERIRHAVVALPSFPGAQLSEVLNRYSDVVPHLLVLSDASTLPTLWGASRSGRLSGIEVRNALLMATLQAMKRVVDLLVAFIALVLTLPLLLLIALAIRLTSPGPVLFGHTRVGRHGREFRAWKFRTMYQNGDTLLREYLGRVVAARQEWDRVQKLKFDPRVTPVGRLLRITSLDELPQIWNVLIGNMSIVGPRPIIRAEVSRYGDVFRLYSTVKPGITGLWQVSGRSNVSYDDRVRLDQFYVRHWSPWLDIYILAKTVVALMKRDGAY